MANSNIPITPPTSYNFATPEIGVEIYPHTGGSYTLLGTPSGANVGVVSAEIVKDIRDREGGKFIVNLTPGGPNGIDDSNSWTNIINVCSLVVIYLSRAGSQRIVMVGIVTQITEDQMWNNNRVIRTVKIAGSDFTYYFNAFSYYTLTYLGLIENSVPGSVAGQILGQFGQQLDGPPAELAYLWFKYVMVGTNPAQKITAVMQQTYVMYKGQKIYISQLFAYWFEAFVENGQNVFIPFLLDVANSEGSWWDKLLSILSWPFYETFVTTGNATDYPSITTSTNSASNPTVGISTNSGSSYGGLGIQAITVPGYNSVYPIIIGRVNPLPWVSYPPLNSSTSSTLARSRWDNLALFSLGNFSYINSSVSYSANEVGNFFGVTTFDSSCIANSAGTADANLFAFELLGGIIDQYSINTYGFRPVWAGTRWLTSIQQIVSPSQFNPGSLSPLASVLLGKLASYYIPTPNMLDGKVTIPMWPDILPGNKFLYNPFKDSQDLYEFYIESVAHVYEFGGKSSTTLELSRGLKYTDYNNQTTMVGLHLDTYARINGQLSQRSDASATGGAYYINPGITTNIGTLVGSYLGPPGNINNSSS